jgi:hypothetical protein
MPSFEAQKDMEELKKILDKGKLLSVEIKQYRKKRSLDANSLLWVLCQKLAEVLHTTKEEVYKKAIRDVGQFEIVPIRNDAVDAWIRRWGSKGIGWFAEVLVESKIPGYKNVITYFGSSSYDTREISILIDEIVGWCQQMDIESATEDELQRLKDTWGSSDEQGES